MLNLPNQLKAHRVHPTFHMKLLQAHEPNNDTMFPRRDTQVFYKDAEWVVNKLVAHRWKGAQIEFLVKWNLGDTTWEPYAHCKELEALDRYLKLQGAASVRQLLRWMNTMCNECELCERPEGNPPINGEGT